MNRLMMMLSMGLLLAPEGEEGGGGGGGDSQSSGAPAETTAGQNAPAAPNVSREEFDSLSAKLDRVLEGLEKKQSAGQSAPAKKPTSEAEQPEWARNLEKKLDSINADKAKEAAANRRRMLVDKVLAGVPDSNRGLAELAVEGLVASQGVDFSKDFDVEATARTLAGTLRGQFGSQLFADRGSPHVAIPTTGDGKYDFSGVQSLDEVPTNMIRHIPDDIYARLRAGMPASGQGSNGEIRPFNKFN